MYALFCNFGIVLVALRGVGRLLGAGSGFVRTLIFFISQAVEARRTALHNRLVASYHKAKRERADFARELEVAKGKVFFL